MDADAAVLIWYAYRYSTETGKAVEAVVKPELQPTRRQIEHLYKLLKSNGAKHLSRDVYMALLDALRRASRPH